MDAQRHVLPDGLQPRKPGGRGLPKRRGARSQNPISLTGFDVKRPVAESHLTAMILAAERGTDTFVARKQGAQSIREFDVLVEDNDALLVAHDIVAVQTVAEFVEIIFALGTLVAPGGKDGGADFVWLGRARLVDRG